MVMCNVKFIIIITFKKIVDNVLSPFFELQVIVM